MSTAENEGEGGEGDKVRIAEFALGLLDAAEHERVARMIAGHPGLARELQAWRLRFSALDAEFEAVEPPPRVLERLESRLFPQPAAERRPSLWESLAFWRGLAGGALALAVLALGFSVLRPPSAPPAAPLVASLEEQGSAVRFMAVVDPATGSVRLTSLAGETVPEHDFELWYIVPDVPPVSMGLVPLGSPTEIVVTREHAEHLHEGTVLAITLEPKGGAPAGVPTGPVVAKGPVTRI